MQYKLVQSNATNSMVQLFHAFSVYFHLFDLFFRCVIILIELSVYWSHLANRSEETRQINLISLKGSAAQHISQHHLIVYLARNNNAFHQTSNSNYSNEKPKTNRGFNFSPNCELPESIISSIPRLTDHLKFVSTFLKNPTKEIHQYDLMRSTQFSFRQFLVDTVFPLVSNLIC